MIVFCLSLVFITFSVQALTDEELGKFTTTGRTEQNTGLVGTVSITSSGNDHVLTSNGIPDHDTGNFPANFNPNSISSQNYQFTFPQNPTVASQMSCLPMGPIAFATNGIPIFNPYTNQGHNAVEGDNAETFDSCNGHPDERGSYHYHQNPSCLNTSSENDKFVGVALDGFPIYGPKDSNGKILTISDVDECNGRYVNETYRYHVTTTFPYIMGCYKGTRSGQNPPGKCEFALNSGSKASVIRQNMKQIIVITFFIFMVTYF